MADGRRKVIVDVDVGTDDFLALLILLNAEKRRQIKIEAIVCSMGNTAVENVCVNVMRLLEAVERTDIPVFKGATKQLIPPTHEIRLFHGKDGFGDLGLKGRPHMEAIKEPAASKIAELIVGNPGEISLICVAPLTNVALALRLYDNFADSIKDLWIMGGNYTAVGNITPTAEYNFYIDPEAAFIVLDTVKKPIFILTWETCLYPKITFDWRFKVFGAKKNPAIELLNLAERSVYKEDEKIWLPCDAFLAAAFLKPEIITKKSAHYASVELHGSQTRGQIVLDHLKTKKENVTIIEQFDAEAFQQILMDL
ncbi:nucleoside hydrolase [Tribolium castaneum]|uniref:Pyrimidine-specific ribonucleoside hydrolase RihA-like Protein n=1 Tax=Tribolium castaneum TaxID=7070 RepID=D6WK34_TRICA|nr:PREDICTED: pyrimidine-specific ribonucleoside hydrolase RihA [Tribolium castaneum]EFA03941.1 Pyrimidine-specific ribonucleoside hydrolase RihA-like Protein [Tribolium castaneum]|eukprot:XP_967256.1 PREDICTED: pyrimidine-specific ribonucleoside hydrolase RihA [Tribolium castaneum]